MSSVNQLDALRNLSENWDGYHAAAPHVQAIDLAQELAGLIECLLRRNHADPVMHVSPTRAGGVLLEWQAGPVEHEIEIGADGSVGFLHRHASTGAIHTRRFAPEPGVVQAGFLQELRQLLAA